MRAARIALLLLLACGASAAAAQTMYRWVDQNGRTHVTDTPPPAGAKEVRKQAAGRAGAAQEGAHEPYAVQMARQKNPVTLYTTPGCEACTEARKLLNARGVPFSEVSVNSQKALEELKNAVGSNSVPSLVVGSTVQKGFEESIYNQALDAAGYPKAGLLPPRKQDEPVDPKADAKPAPEAPQPSGPYAPGARPQPSRKK